MPLRVSSSQFDFDPDEAVYCLKLDKTVLIAPGSDSAVQVKFDQAGLAELQLEHRRRLLCYGPDQLCTMEIRNETATRYILLNINETLKLLRVLQTAYVEAKAKKIFPSEWLFFSYGGFRHFDF